MKYRLLLKDIYLFLVSVLLLFMFWEFLSIFLLPWLARYLPELRLWISIFIIIFSYFSFVFVLRAYKKILNQYILFSYLMAIFFPAIYFLYKYLSRSAHMDVLFLLMFANSFILLGLLVLNFRQLKKIFHKW